jgi:RimJ/RimL family protein N-acetyltransferase
MITELERSRWTTVRPLFAELEAFNVCIGGVFEGWNPGAIFVDDADAPRTAFMYTPEGTHLAGAVDNPTFRDAFPAFVTRTLFDAFDWRALYLILTPEWDAAALDYVGRDLLTDDRRYYECRDLAYDWRTNLPEGFTVQRIDADLLARAAAMPEDAPSCWAHIRRWVCNGWRSPDRFLRDGFGFVTLHDGAIVSWSLCDGRSADRCEIGIQTMPEYRRRGLAAVTAAATVEHALNTGFTVVGWHCDDNNIGSYRTAEKVGFTLQRRYQSHTVLSDELRQEIAAQQR